MGLLRGRNERGDMSQSSQDPAPPDQAGDALRAFPGLDKVAVALRYERDAGTLPRIVASGRGSVADQIMAVAQAAGITVRQDADLAEVLVALEVGSDIPVEAFAAVAEILSYIYRANQYQAASRPAHDAAAARASDAYRPDSRPGRLSEDRRS